MHRFRVVIPNSLWLNMEPFTSCLEKLHLNTMVVIVQACLTVLVEYIGTLVGLVCGTMDSHYLWGCLSGLAQMEKALDGKKVRRMIASARRAV